MSIQLREIKKDDLEMIMEWRMLPEVTKYMYTDPDLTMEDQMKWYESIKENDRCLYWIINIDDTDIGVINLVDINEKHKRCGWAYYIADSSFRGRGLGRALEGSIYEFVFEELNLNKLWCEVFKSNEKVVAIHEKYGSEVEGVFKDHIYKNNEFRDVVAMGITKEKWDKIKSDFKYEKIDIEY